MVTLSLGWEWPPCPCHLWVSLGPLGLHPAAHPALPHALVGGPSGAGEPYQWGNMGKISAQEMAAHVRAGRAWRWTHELGRGRLILNAASLDGTWYAVLDDTGTYVEVPAPFAALLTAVWANIATSTNGTTEARSARC